jgi:fluoride exporter
MLQWSPMKLALMVMAGGAAGTLARAGMNELLPVHPGAWPWATFIVNLLGAALLGWLTTTSVETRTLVGTGFCGALTTFSTFQLETLKLADHGDWLLAVLYMGASVVAGLGAAQLGERYAR